MRNSGRERKKEYQDGGEENAEERRKKKCEGLDAWKNKI